MIVAGSPHPRSIDRLRRWLLPVVVTLLATSCGTTGAPLSPPERLSVGTWGGDNAGVIVDDTIAHVHVGCTFGNFGAPVALDRGGAFDVAGSYVLRAYPITVGPPVPARFAGVVHGTSLTLTITVNDTVEHQTVVRGPVTVTFGAEPRMGPCPICRTAADGARRLREIRTSSLPSSLLPAR